MARAFVDRKAAGEILAAKLGSLELESPLVVALPRGGVPVAAPVAQILSGSLDVLLVKKIGVPGHEELALGAVTESGEPYWNEQICKGSGLSETQLSDLANEKRAEALSLRKRWNLSESFASPFGRDVIVVDDGLATGATMMAAVQILRREKPRKIAVAVPVASRQAVAQLRPLVDHLEVLMIPEAFSSVGLWYKDFTQVRDEDMLRLLKLKARNESEDVVIEDGFYDLSGRLEIPENMRALVIFAHGSGSTHKSPRNLKVARALRKLNIGTLLFDLLTPAEASDRANVFNVELLAHRLAVATRWARSHMGHDQLPIGYFGASTGAAAALTAAARDREIFAVVSRGGRPDLAIGDLDKVDAPVLLIVGGADGPVIPLNEAVRNKLKSAELVIVPGAGHLFEEQGAMDQVIEYAADWFLQSIPKPVVVAAHTPVEEVTRELELVAKAAPQDRDLDDLIRRMSQARVVMLGESSHGTEEFYEIRKVISQKLIADYGFKFIAVEGDWPDCAKLNRYIRDPRTSGSAVQVMEEFQRWPTWMWANYQTAELIEWMKGKGAGFFGLDVYSLNESLEILKSYVERVSPDVADSIGLAYGCFEPYNRKETSYGARLMQIPEGCKHEAVACLNKLVRARIESTNLEFGELFDARQNALIVKNAEAYYRSMVDGGPESWNVRDRHMMETLDALLRYHGENSKAIVWAHNTHIGDYHATSMVEDGYLNLGGLARERYGIENVFLVGLGTYAGDVLAGQAWAAMPEVMAVPPAREGSYEAYLHNIAKKEKAGRLIVSLEKDSPALAIRRGHRAIGVVYQPRFEARGHNYVPTSLRDRYDAFIFYDRTSALKPIATQIRKGLLPETWPTGQ